MECVLKEYSELVLPDQRLTKRVQKFLEAAWNSPAASLPKMFEDAVSLEGAYRLMSNERVSFDALHQPHRERTACRAQDHGTVVVVHDTTDVETAYASPEEVGYLSTGRTGYRAHVSLAISVELDRPARPLGVLHVETLFNRNPPSPPGTKKKPPKRQSMVHSKDKSSLRWQRGVEGCAEILEQCSSVVHVADREADNYALFSEILQLGQNFVIRLRNDRIAREVDDEACDADWSQLRTIATELTGKFERLVPLSKRGAKGITTRAKTHPPREARCAELSYSATHVEVQRPRPLPANDYPPTLELWLVRVWEPNPPAGEQPIEWLLLTSEPCETEAEIARVVDIYRSRWMIEDFFKALKTGCALEDRQLESRRSLLNFFALMLPIAVHLLWLRTCARDTPDASATEVLTPLQLTVLQHRSHRPLPKNPTAAQALWALAGIGGHLANNGWPGWQVLGRAFVTLAEAVRMWEIATRVASEQNPPQKRLKM